MSSLIAVLVAAAANFIIGFMFHGPLFGKLWMRLANIVPTGNEKFSQMIPQMVKNFLMNVVASYGLAVFINVIAGFSNDFGNPFIGMKVAFVVWLGFIVTSSSMDVIWMGKSKKLWMFECFSSLLVMASMGIVIAVW